MVKVFFSYSHKDEALRDTLQTHLTVLQRQGIISIWHDRRLNAGDNLSNVIDKNLIEADIILMLVSSDFLASDYCYNIEMGKALERNNNGDAKVIPIILRPCDWLNSPLKDLLAVPKDGRPVTRFSNADEAFLEITTAIRAAIQALGKKVELMPVDNKLSGNFVVIDSPRSSNLRIKKSFSDHEKIDFLTNGFEFIAKFFDESLAELQKRNPGITTRYRRIDANQFQANIFNNGNEVNVCRIRLSENGSFGNGITYSAGHMNENSVNEILSIKEDIQELFLTAAFGNFTRIEMSEYLNHLGAAEYYWAHFIEPLQR